MTDIRFNCPQCGRHLAVDAMATGTTVACPKCGQAIIVPNETFWAIDEQGRLVFKYQIGTSKQNRTNETAGKSYLVF